MDLVLWRHAAAEEAGTAQPDLERRLTPRGERDAERMAAWLDRHLPEDLLVIASPAERCQATVARLGRKWRTVAQIGPDAGAEQLLAAAGWPDAKRNVVLVGHQPALGRAAALALTGEAADWPIRKGALWWLRRREREGAVETLLVCAQAPETV